MMISTKQKKFLRGKAHSLSALVQVGKGGVTQTLIEEVKRALNDHELIKVKVNGDDREEIRGLISELSSQCGAELVQVIGHTAVLYRRSELPGKNLIALP